MVDRPHLIDSIKRKLEKFPCVILLGLRQVGKTTISKNLIVSDVKYLDLEKPKDKYLLEAGVSEYLENFSNSVVVIDEVQLLPFFFQNLDLSLIVIRKQVDLFFWVPPIQHW
ncbi:MAG: AAA family ATPase [Saprospiraceae bacterium]|nr:AAA family ATPase [Saprospiraceae bacterium]